MKANTWKKVGSFLMATPAIALFGSLAAGGVDPENRIPSGPMDTAEVTVLDDKTVIEEAIGFIGTPVIREAVGITFIAGIACQVAVRKTASPPEEETVQHSAA
jgi:hypothetical protein